MTKQKLVVAVDCDDVLIESVGPILDHYNRLHGTTIDQTGYYDEHVLATWNASSLDEIVTRINRYLETPEYMNLAPVRETVEVLGRLTAWCELHVVTGRPKFTEALTIAWLERHLPGVFQSVESTGIFTSQPRSKADVCTQLGASFLVDDHIKHCRDVAEVGVQAILFGDFPWSQGSLDSTLITRVANWTGVEKVLLAYAERR